MTDRAARIEAAAKLVIELWERYAGKRTPGNWAAGGSVPWPLADELVKLREALAEPDGPRIVAPEGVFDVPDPVDPTYIVVCALPAGEKNWRPDPFPGSLEAKEVGCLCPALQPWPGQLHFASGCPVHALTRVGS